MAVAISERISELGERLRNESRKRYWAVGAAGGGILTGIVDIVLASTSPYPNKVMFGHALVGSMVVIIGGIADGMHRDQRVKKLLHQQHGLELAGPLERLEHIAAELPSATIEEIENAIAEIDRVTRPKGEELGEAWQNVFESVHTVFSRTTEGNRE